MGPCGCKFSTQHMKYYNSDSTQLKKKKKNLNPRELWKKVSIGNLKWNSKIQIVRELENEETRGDVRKLSK